MALRSGVKINWRASSCAARRGAKPPKEVHHLLVEEVLGLDLRQRVLIGQAIREAVVPSLGIRVPVRSAAAQPACICR